MQTPKHPLKVGDCLLENFEKHPNQIIKVEYRHDQWWYSIRSFEDGHLAVIPEGYIPYSYSVIDCPAKKVPPPPPIKVGDCVEWDKGKGIVKKIQPDGEVEVETERVKLGARGIAYPDIYELHSCELKPKELELTDFELYNTQYSLKQLQEMAKSAGLSTSGLKQDLINRLVQRGVLK